LKNTIVTGNTANSRRRHLQRLWHCRPHRQHDLGEHGPRRRRHFQQWRCRNYR
jgi:hypothetical protein